MPYKDNALPDLMAGRLSFTVRSSAATVPLITTGKLKGLAVLSTQRLASLPDTPTTAEAHLIRRRLELDRLDELHERHELDQLE